MVTDLRTVNKVIQPMDSLHPGIPLPSLLPNGWPLTVFDLKDYFVTIQEKDREKFTFTEHSYNSQPVKNDQ